MARTTPTRRRLLSAAAVGVAASAVLFGLAPVAAASEGTPSHDPGVTHPDLDFAGSQIAKHEGGGQVQLGDPAATTRTPGLDVSNYQGSVDWATVAGHGAAFAYMKATEGTGYVSPSFAAQYAGSRRAGLVRGAYHFALPDRSAAIAQADYFVAHGGTWTQDGYTLPPMLDLEYNPYGATCYGLGQGAMRSWIKSFSDRLRARTGRYPTIYTSTSWWTKCTGNWAGLGATNPLFVARYAADPGPLPAGWPTWTFWQFADHGAFPGDQDYFNGTPAGLRGLARG
jgi:GH25 family lysozyme M1 (1,4-beta-N-acetylmuramidase)